MAPIETVPALMLTLPVKVLVADSTKVPAPVLLMAVLTPPVVSPVPPMESP